MAPNKKQRKKSREIRFGEIKKRASFHSYRYFDSKCFKLLSLRFKVRMRFLSGDNYQLNNTVRRLEVRATLQIRLPCPLNIKCLLHVKNKKETEHYPLLKSHLQALGRLLKHSLIHFAHKIHCTLHLPAAARRPFLTVPKWVDDLSYAPKPMIYIIDQNLFPSHLRKISQGPCGRTNLVYVLDSFSSL